MMNDDLWDRADALAVARGFEPAFSAYKLYTNKGCSRHEFDERMAILDEVIREDATSASDARYQGRIKELEEALRLIEDHHNETEEWRDIAHKSLSTTTPDTALQKALLEARIVGFESCIGRTSDEIQMLLGKAYAQLAALGE